MKLLAALLLLCSVSAQAIVVNGPCPQTAGNITAVVTPNRPSGISPLMIWLDATGTTYSGTLPGANNIVTDLTYIWNFGDTLASGTTTWTNGSNPNGNSKNLATGIVGAHLYQTAGRDTKYSYTLTITDGTSTLSCGGQVTAFDPNGANGYPGVQTICHFASTLGSGCPAGAAHVGPSATIVVGNMTGGRRLYKCGDTFTSNGVAIGGTGGTLGAYGGCEGTQTNRPIFKATAIVDGLITGNNPSADMRIMDIAFDGNCSGGGQTGTLPCTGANQGGTIIFDNQAGGNINGGNFLHQYTLYNLDAKNHEESYMWNAGDQMAVVSSTAQAVWNGCGFNCINVRPNTAGVGTGTGSQCSNCNWTDFTIHEAFGALLGNMFTDGASGNNSAETVRVPYMLKFVIANNTLLNAGPAFAILKMHNLWFNVNTGSSTNPFNGTYYSQYNVISDNLIAGSSGAQCMEFSPQNPTSDERMRYNLIERNLLACTNSGFGNGRDMWISSSFSAIRDNAFNITPGAQCCFGIFLGSVGIEPSPTSTEIFNNTFAGAATTAMISLNPPISGAGPSTSAIVQNNLVYNTTGGPVVSGTGTTPTISNNTGTTTLNPGFTNGSSSFIFMTDFKPTANFSGATSVPVFYDAVGGGVPPPYGTAVQWPPTWDLGAVHH